MGCVADTARRPHHHPMCCTAMHLYKRPAGGQRPWGATAVRTAAAATHPGMGKHIAGFHQQNDQLNQVRGPVKDGQKT